MYNILKLLVLSILLLIARFAAIKFINSDRVSKNYIHDICHNILPNMKITKLKRILYDSYTLIPIFLVFGLSIHYGKYQLLTKFIAILLILNLLRPIFYVITIMPDPCDKCSDEVNNNNWYEILMGSCKDMIFSGHVSNSFLGLLYLVRYFNVSFIYVMLHQIILITLMLCQRRHYTIDIIIAYLVTILVFDYRKSILNFLQI